MQTLPSGGDSSVAKVGDIAAASRSHVTPESAAPRIVSLDGLRAISILLVIIGHARNAIPKPGPGWPSHVSSIVGNQALGVEIFFVLSGFLITTLLLREEEERHDISLPRFYLRRAFRILPAFYTYVAVVWLLNRQFDLGVTPLHFLSAITFTWNYVPDTQGWYFIHTWSLSVEEQFYLVWPLILRALGRKRATWFAGIIILILPLVRIATYVLMPALRGRIGIMGHTRFDILMCGCLLALLPWNGRIMSRLKALVVRRDVQAAFLSYLFLVSPLLEERFKGKFLLPVGFSLDAICIALLVLWVVHVPQSAFGRFLNLRWVTRLGVLSYSLYLWQQILTAPDPSPVGRWLPLNLVAAYLIAECSYRWIEQPLLRLRKRLVGT